MKEKLKITVPVLLLLALWLIPLYSGGLTWDADFIKTVAAYGLYTAATFLCGLLSNRHAALISALLLGAALCVLQPNAVYDILPPLLLCGWLRCYSEREKGNAVTVYFELFTDLLYACFGMSVIRLISYGYHFPDIKKSDLRTVPELCLMVFVLLLFAVLFIAGAGGKAESDKEKQKKTRRAQRGITGMLPVYISLRTFWGFCALYLAVCLAHYTSVMHMHEAFLFFRTGYRLLFLPWLVLLYFALAAFLPKTAFAKLFLRE